MLLLCSRCGNVVILNELRLVSILCHFSLFLSCVGVFNSAVRTLAHGLLTHTPNLRLRFILEKASLLASYICATTPGLIQGRAIAPLKHTNFFHHDFEHSENSIRNIRPFFRPLFCHKSVVRILHLSYYNEPVMRLDFQILLISPPLKLTSGSAPAPPTVPLHEVVNLGSFQCGPVTVHIFPLSYHHFESPSHPQTLP